MTEEDANVLLEEIKRAVTEAGLTQVQLAAELGVDQPRVSNLLGARRGAEFSAAQLLLVERAAGLTPGEINRRVALRTGDFAYAAGSETAEDPAAPPSTSSARRRTGVTRPEPDQTR